MMKRITLLLLIIISMMSILMSIEKGANKMGKTLIVYQSKTGSTTEIAKYMQTQLKEKGIDTDLILANQNVDLKSYQSIIIGSPIYAGRWKKECTKFVEIHQKELQKKNVYFFSVGMSFDSNDPKKIAEADQYLERERKMIAIKSEGRFMGRMDFSKLSFFERLLVKMMGSKNEDKRDWEKIKNWINQISQ